MTSLHSAMNLERKMLSAAKASLHSAMNQSVRCDRRESGTSIVTVKRTPVLVRGFSLRGQKQQPLGHCVETSGSIRAQDATDLNREHPL